MVIGQAISQATCCFSQEVGHCRDHFLASSMDSRNFFAVELSRGTHSFHELFDDVVLFPHGISKSGQPISVPQRGITINVWLKSDVPLEIWCLLMRYVTALLASAKLEEARRHDLATRSDRRIDRHSSSCPHRFEVHRISPNTRRMA